MERLIEFLSIALVDIVGAFSLVVPARRA